MNKSNKEIEFYFEGERSLEELLLELIVIKISSKWIKDELR